MASLTRTLFLELKLLWTYSLALAVAWALSSARGEELPIAADAASQIALPLILALWVCADARRRCVPLCYDFDTFVFFAWPILLPIYLFKTRGLKAVLDLCCFFVLGLSSATVGYSLHRLLSPSSLP